MCLYLTGKELLTCVFFLKPSMAIGMGFLIFAHNREKVMLETAQCSVPYSQKCQMEAQTFRGCSSDMPNKMRFVFFQQSPNIPHPTSYSLQGQLSETYSKSVTTTLYFKFPVKWPPKRDKGSNYRNTLAY